MTQRGRQRQAPSTNRVKIKARIYFFYTILCLLLLHIYHTYLYVQYIYIYRWEHKQINWTDWKDIPLKATGFWSFIYIQINNNNHIQQPPSSASSERETKHLLICKPAGYMRFRRYLCVFALLYCSLVFIVGRIHLHNQLFGTMHSLLTGNQEEAMLLMMNIGVTPVGWPWLFFLIESNSSARQCCQINSFVLRRQQHIFYKQISCQKRFI